MSCTRSAAFHVLPSVHLSLPPLGDCWAPAEGLLGGGAAGELLEDCWRLLGDYWRTAGGLLQGGSAEGPRNGRWINEKVEDGRWMRERGAGGLLGVTVFDSA